LELELGIRDRVWVRYKILCFRVRIREKKRVLVCKKYRILTKSIIFL
jgi:hypothetical protein